MLNLALPSTGEVASGVSTGLACSASAVYCKSVNMQKKNSKTGSKSRLTVSTVLGVRLVLSLRICVFLGGSVVCTGIFVLALALGAVSMSA